MKKIVLIALVLLSATGGLAALAMYKPHRLPLFWHLPYTQWEVGGAEFKPEALDALNQIRMQTHTRYLIVSGYRSPSHNKDVGGVSDSQHIEGHALDVLVPMEQRDSFYEAAKAAGFTGYGWGSNTVHIDRGAARWWTYNNNGDAMSGKQKLPYLYKAPESFKRDHKL